MFFTLIQITGLMLLANATVYAGIFFINGDFLPNMMSGLYEATNYMARLLICMVTFLILGNILFAKGFEWFDPVLVAPVNIIAFVLIQVAIAMLVSKTVPSLMLVPALAILCGSVYWVYILISKVPVS